VRHVFANKTLSPSVAEFGDPDLS